MYLSNSISTIIVPPISSVIPVINLYRYMYTINKQTFSFSMYSFFQMYMCIHHIYVYLHTNFIHISTNYFIICISTYVHINYHFLKVVISSRHKCIPPPIAVLLLMMMMMIMMMMFTWKRLQRGWSNPTQKSYQRGGNM
jgi:hypothetical protein